MEELIFWSGFSFRYDSTAGCTMPLVMCLYSGGFRVGSTPLCRLVVYFCVHNCTSPSNDYAAVACSNNNQAQLHTHVSVPYWSPDVWLGLELLRDIQFGLPAILNNSLASYQSVLNTSILRSDNNYVCHKRIYVTRSGRGNPKIFGCASRTSGWTPLSKFLNPPLLYSTVFPLCPALQGQVSAINSVV